ncbi:RNA-directed DNA polymerase, eukaryota [Tanacetum coccineum]
MDILIVVIYAPHDVRDKRLLWDYLSHVSNQWAGEVVMMGDFNEVRYKSDRFGSNFNAHGADIFNNFIINAGLEEVPLGGSAYTWCHKSASKMSKLDRFLVSENLLNTCPNISAITLDRFLSDNKNHGVILLLEGLTESIPEVFMPLSVIQSIALQSSLLTLYELKEFDMLSDDYEINWHLNHLRSVINPTSEDLKSRSTKVKNRRRAFMYKLMYDGKLFSEDLMRDREPYLHHEFVGKFQDQSGRRMSRHREKWSETLLRRAEEALLMEKIHMEQQRLGVDEMDWVGNDRREEEQEEEEEEDEDDEEVEEGKHGDANVREMLSEYIDVNTVLPALSSKVIHRVLEMLKYFNTRACQLVLGVGAITNRIHADL